MFNRVKFVIKKSLLQNSKNSQSIANKKVCNNKSNSNKNFNRFSVRKFSSFSNKQPNEPRNFFLIAAIVCGTLFTFKSTLKKD